MLLPSYLVLTSFSPADPSNTEFLANTFTVYSVTLSRSPTDRLVIPGSVILTFFISVPPCSITTLYAVIGLPPSSAGAVHFTVSDVASVSNCPMFGNPGFATRTKNMNKPYIDEITVAQHVL